MMVMRVATYPPKGKKMKYNSRAFALAALLAFAAPLSATAASILVVNPITAGETYTWTSVINPGDGLEFRFNVLEDLDLASFSLAATGNNGGSDVADIRFGFAMPLDGVFTTIIASGTSAAGLGFLPGASFMMGDVFSIFFEDGITDEVGVSVSFRTDVAAVPLPATALLLGPFLLGGGFAAARRRKLARTAAV